MNDQPDESVVDPALAPDPSAPDPPSVAPVKEGGTRTGFVVAGLLVMLGGLLLLLFSLGMLLLPPPGPDGPHPSSSPQQLRLVALAFALLALPILALGVGVVARRRWARALLLLGAANLTCMGLLTAGLLLAPSGPLPPGSRAAGLLFIVPCWILIPGWLWWFLAREKSRLHVERLCPLPCWTDRHPLPVLGLILLMASGALALLLMPLLQADRTLAGLARGGGFFWKVWWTVTGLASLLLAVGLWRRRRWAWRGALVYHLLVWGVGLLLTRQPDLVEHYRAQGLHDAEIGRLMQQGGLTDPGSFAPWLGLPVMLLNLAWLFWIRAYFHPPRPEEEVDPPA